jgi:hypothetical protein
VCVPCRHGDGAVARCAAANPCQEGDPKCLRRQPFGRYAEIPYDQMTPEQQEGYRLLIETRGALGGPNKVWGHNPKLAKVMAV